ncbi:MAG: hypothetical protein H7323_06565 [Frankiales bacterium]|nr:hypothetical protein [Frankiales bacterium]
MTEELHVELARRLKQAHRRVASLNVDDDEKARVAGRLIALTDASKRDVGRASHRLDLLLADLDAGRRLAPDDQNEPG